MSGHKNLDTAAQRSGSCAVAVTVLDTQQFLVNDYLRRSVGFGAVASGRQGAALSQTFGWVTNHWLLLLLIGGIVVVVATISLIMQHLALAVCHTGEGRVLHGGRVGHSPTIKRGVRLWTGKCH